MPVLYTSWVKLWRNCIDDIFKHFKLREWCLFDSGEGEKMCYANCWHYLESKFVTFYVPLLPSPLHFLSSPSLPLSPPLSSHLFLFPFSFLCFFLVLPRFAYLYSFFMWLCSRLVSSSALKDCFLWTQETIRRDGLKPGQPHATLASYLQ